MGQLDAGGTLTRYTVLLCISGQPPLTSDTQWGAELTWAIFGRGTSCSNVLKSSFVVAIAAYSYGNGSRPVLRQYYRVLGHILIMLILATTTPPHWLRLITKALIGL